MGRGSKGGYDRGVGVRRVGSVSGVSRGRGWSGAEWCQEGGSRFEEGEGEVGRGGGSGVRVFGVGEGREGEVGRGKVGKGGGVRRGCRKEGEGRIGSSGLGSGG